MLIVWLSSPLLVYGKCQCRVHRAVCLPAQLCTVASWYLDVGCFCRHGLTPVWRGYAVRGRQSRNKSACSYASMDGMCLQEACIAAQATAGCDDDGWPAISASSHSTCITLLLHWTELGPGVLPSCRMAALSHLLCSCCLAVAPPCCIVASTTLAGFESRD